MSPYFVLLILGLLVWVGFLVLQYRKIKEEARAVFDASVRRNEISASEDYSIFERVYLKTSDLRVGVYRITALIAAIISLPISISVVGFIWARFYYLLDRPAWMTEGELVHSFFLAVSGMLGLVGVAAIFARRYHEFRPGRFEDEWEAEKSNSVDKTDAEPAKTH